LERFFSHMAKDGGIRLEKVTTGASVPAGLVGIRT
jgi:hypothetical protein